MSWSSKMNQSTSSCGEYSSWKRSNSWTWLLIENHCNRLYQRLTHHQTPKLERIYTMGPCMIHYIDNSWKVAPISTSTAPIATYHCTFMDVNVLLSKMLRWLPQHHPHELSDWSNDFTFIPYTCLSAGQKSTGK